MWFGVAVGPVLLVVVALGWGSRGYEIRVQNVSGVELRDVEVDGIFLGDLLPGEATEYHSVELAYLDVSYSGRVNGSARGATLVDDDGRRRLGRGKHTYLLSTVERDGNLVLRLDLAVD